MCSKYAATTAFSVDAHIVREYCACAGHVGFLVNSTLVSLSATVKTDIDKTVVVTALETLDDVLRALRKLSFSISKEAADSLLTSVQDVLDNKVQCLIWLPLLIEEVAALP